MNTLSWFLYLADVINTVQGVFIFGGVASILFLGAKTIYVTSFNDMSINRDRQKPLPSFWKNISLAMLMFALAGLIPSKETVYMIAGSELGETAVTSERGERIMNDIETILDLQIEKLKSNGG